ncbi:MAG: acetyl-CoA carboxylase biotin carboxyl carrier protein [Burkholderiaceae bacterium]
MDLRKLKTLIDLVSESNVSELEITEAEGKIRIVKGGYLPAQVAAVPLVAAAPVVQPAQVVAVEVAAPNESTDHAVKSPMVGSFYRGASPGAKPFVEVGDSIKLGQTLCIIEAMKILNEIESDKAGTLKQILCENGQAVEYGQSMFIIE